MDRLLSLLRAPIVCITLCGQERTAWRGCLDHAIRGMIKTVGSRLLAIRADIFAARMEPHVPKTNSSRLSWLWLTPFATLLWRVLPGRLSLFCEGCQPA